MKDLGQLIKEATREPTHVKELVMGEESSLQRNAGCLWRKSRRRVASRQKKLAPVVWRVAWPQEVKDALVTWENPNGTTTNSDLEMAAELLGWLVLEANVPLRHEHVGLCSDNSATVSWQMRGASKRSAVANRLLRVLAITCRTHFRLSRTELGRWIYAR